MRKFRLKVFQFRLEVMYGSGIMLLAAANEKMAKEHVEKTNKEMREGQWKFEKQLDNVHYASPDKSHVVLLTIHTRIE